MSEYVFAGEVIKLTAKDFYKWQDMYKFLNLTEELQQLDMEFEARRDSGDKINKWFVECIKRLNGRNKTAERFNHGSNKQSNGYGYSPVKASHADRTRAQAREALERIDRENGSAPIHPNGGFVQ